MNIKNSTPLGKNKFEVIFCNKLIVYNKLVQKFELF